MPTHPDWSARLHGTSYWIGLGMGLLVACGGDQAAASDQSEGFDGFLPLIRPLRLGATFTSEAEPGTDSADGTEHYARFSTLLSLRTQLYRTDSDEVTLSAQGGVSAFNSDIVLPDGSALPDRLYRLQGGLGYRHLFADGYVVGLSGSVGSASDHPFAGLQETSIGATVFVRLPSGPLDSWLLFLNYANDRALLNNIPLPGMGYLMVRDQTWVVFLGIPFVFVTWHPSPVVEADIALSGLGSAHAGVALRPVASADWLRVRIAYDWRPETYKPVDRPTADDQLIFREMRMTAGVGVESGTAMSANAYAGYVFHREIFVDDSISGNADDRVWITPGWVIGLSLKMRF